MACFSPLRSSKRKLAPLLPAVAFCVLVVYFTQFTSWNGIWSLYEQHARPLPVPFFGM